MLKSVFFVAVALILAAEAAPRDREENEGAKHEDVCPEKCKSKPLELSFVVDGSASIWPANFTLGLNFIEDFVDLFTIAPEAVRVSLITFGDIVYIDDAINFDQSTNNHDLKKAISEVPYHSGRKTNTSGGIWYMLHHQIPQARAGVRKVAIVMTDGNSQETRLTKQAADEAHEEGLEMFAIGIGHDVQKLDPQELHNIASDEKHVIRADSYNDLQGILKRLAYEACEVTPMPKCEMEPVDLSFVIDSSASIGEGNFTVGMHFVKDFVDSFLINPTAVRVSAITYGYGVYTEDAFNFDAHHNKKDVLDALLAIQWRHGNYTGTGDGIRYMREHQMVDGRHDAAHICIVITDGRSQETQKTMDEARKAQEAGIVMYAVGVGKVGEQLDEAELNGIAGDPERVLTADNYSELNLLKTGLTHLTCDGISETLELKASAYRE